MYIQICIHLHKTEICTLTRVCAMLLFVTVTVANLTVYFCKSDKKTPLSNSKDGSP